MRKAAWTTASVVVGLLILWALWSAERADRRDVQTEAPARATDRGSLPSVEREGEPARTPADGTPRRPPEEGPRRDLQQDELRGGHTIERHVGLTDAQLRARLARESIAAASTFFDLETAERAVGHALAAQATRVAAWEAREGPRPNLVVSHAMSPSAPIGRVLRRGADRSVDGFAVLVVLRWRPDGSFVLTAYPEERARGR